MSADEEKAFFQAVVTAIARKPIKNAWDFDPPASQSTPLPFASRPFQLKDEEAGATGDEATETFEIQVKQLKGGPLLTITASRLDSVDLIKQKIEKETGLSADCQRLVFNGKGLSDNKTLFDFGIAAGSTLHLLKKAGAATKEPVVKPNGDAEVAAAPTSTPVTPAESTLISASKAAAANPKFWNSIYSVLAEHFPEKADQKKF
ncbi:hypothetical protein HK101_004141 [Irineochytrium annulatum]|nr:hypothetical protein HK101_004141 [Irineochytrium annulatum]